MVIYHHILHSYYLPQSDILYDETVHFWPGQVINQTHRKETIKLKLKIIVEIANYYVTVRKQAEDIRMHYEFLRSTCTRNRNDKNSKQVQKGSCFFLQWKHETRQANFRI